ncbi:hypothetical protein ACFX5U_16895 [Sphingobacterium sp. SG20118]|uniref:hypothetical protein n=1 Tax=Sphingobacterium sp. SG20118 TaxID=3367156 RepID=UPI0037DFC5DC
MKFKFPSPRPKKIAKTTLRLFLRKRMMYYVVPNIVFNTLVAYASFQEVGYTHFFAGSQSLARLTLPMAIFLPLILTVDIIKRVSEAADQGAIEYRIVDELNKNRFMAKLAIMHALSTGLLILSFLVLAQLSLSEYYKLDPAPMAILDGFLAGILSVLFTYLPIRKLKKHFYKPVSIVTVNENE